MPYRIVSIFALIFIYIVFAISVIVQNSAFTVLEIITPTKLVLDLNQNGQADFNETICLPDILTFNTKNNSSLEYNLKIPASTSVKMGYLTEEYSKNILLNKKVKFKLINDKSDCKIANIYINNESYEEKLFNSGFGIYNLNKSKQFENKLNEAEKLNIAILNHKSNKYHKLDCKYGQVANDTVLLPVKQLPNNAKPCKFCHTKNSSQAEIIPPQIISSGKVKMFLTDLSVQTTLNNNCNTSICKETISLINKTKETIDIALYGYKTVPAIEKALKQAKERGVKINIVYDTSNSNYYPETKNILNFAKKLSTDTPQALMHNKFMIFDNSKILTGSMNFAPTGFTGFNSNCIFIIDSKELAQIYKNEFNQMLNGAFQHNKIRNNNIVININNTKITPYFSPKDKVITEKIIPLINSAQHYIYIPTFVLTHDKLTQALIDAHKKNIDIKIITDATNIKTKRSKISLLRNFGIKIKTENYAGKMHSKSIIIDNKYLISGSMNLSNSGENKNDENCLIIEDEKLAKYYKEFFEYLWEKIPEKYLNNNALAESKESVGSCYDGIDNDYDGKTDMADESCKQ